MLHNRIASGMIMTLLFIGLAFDVGQSFTIIRLIDAFVDIDPNTLNLKSRGQWITTYIELPEGYDVSNIDISTVRLNDEILAELHPTQIGDYDNDRIPDLTVKFKRQDLIAILSTGEAKLTITGRVRSTLFIGRDTIRVINR
jgi:hypothetical protein